jgi:phytoene synthase
MNYTIEVDETGKFLPKGGQFGIRGTDDKKNLVSFHEEYDFISKLSYKQLQSNPILDIAARVWEEDQYEAAKVCYRSLRIFDDLIDNRKKVGNLSEAEKREYTVMIKDWIKAINNSQPQDDHQKDLIETIKKFQIPLWPFQKFSKAMIYDIKYDGFKTFQAFLRYTEGAAISPASIFVHLCGVEKSNGSYSAPRFDIRKVARPAALFSYLVHILRDFEKDQKNNLNYFAGNLMAEYGLNTTILREVAEGGEVNSNFRSLIKRYFDYAEFYRKKAIHSIDMAAPYLEPRYVISLHIIYELYHQIFERIDAFNGKFTTEYLNPTPEEVRERLNKVIGYDEIFE